MLCVKCKKEIPDGSAYCNLCGVAQTARSQKTKTRGNGQGSVYQLPNKKWRAIKIVGYWVDEDGKRRKKTVSKSDFKTKKEAVEFLPLINKDVEKLTDISFKALYDKWLPAHEEHASKSTMNCYKGAFKHFQRLWYKPMRNITLDELQACIDTCEQGKRTKQNMKVVCGLVYKYGTPRNYIPDNLNLADFLRTGEAHNPNKRGFTDDEIQLIKKGCGKVPYADYIYCLIYTGFRPGEFLALDVSNYDRQRKCLIGGSKTEAGKDRHVTISPKIQPIIDALIENRIAGPLFWNKETKKAFSMKAFRNSCFYPTLQACGIKSPKENGLTPHVCRHTFATLMKNVKASSKDKLELIGHTSEEMLRYYQDVDIEDLRKITNEI